MDGRQRIRRFDTVADAEAFETVRTRARETATPVGEVDPTARGAGIYPYSTKAGIRFRFVFRQSDGQLSGRRGVTSRRAAATARRRLLEAIDRGESKVARETFGESGRP
ncbi:MAG TPA: hypothetical protein VF533_00765 [Solirubrobacteraceae bacterium]